MSQSLQDCPAKLCETRFSTTAAWFSWTQAKMFPVLLGSAAPCRFDISFHPRQNLASRPALTRLLLNSLYHITSQQIQIATGQGERLLALKIKQDAASPCTALSGFFVLPLKGLQFSATFAYILHFGENNTT